MPQPRAASESDATGSDACRDWIEQQIIRAYVQLAVLNDPGGRRTVTLSRLGGLEVRLTETPRIEPPFWLEIHSLVTGSTTDSFGCFEFDEDELEAAIDFVCEAKHRHRPETVSIHGAPAGLDSERRQTARKDETRT